MFVWLGSHSKQVNQEKNKQKKQQQQTLHFSSDLSFGAVKHATIHCCEVVTLGLPSRGWSAVEFVQQKLSTSFGIVMRLQFNCLAISLDETPASKMSGSSPSIFLRAKSRHASQPKTTVLMEAKAFFFFSAYCEHKKIKLDKSHNQHVRKPSHALFMLLCVERLTSNLWK